MKDEYKDLKEDVIDEEKAIDETLERLLNARNEFDSKNRNYLVEPAMGTYLMNYYKVIKKILEWLCIDEFRRDRPPPKALAVADSFDDYTQNDYVDCNYTDF